MTKYLSLTALVALLTIGCGGGLSTEDATEECDEIRQRLTQCMSEDATFQSCVSCFEECGIDCEFSDQCPATFACTD